MNVYLLYMSRHGVVTYCSDMGYAQRPTFLYVLYTLVLWSLQLL